MLVKWSNLPIVVSLDELQGICLWTAAYFCRVLQKSRSSHLILFPVCLLDISCTVRSTEIGYEGEDFTFHVGYPSDYEENSKYFGRSDGFFFEKLVQTTESNRWTRHGRFALLDNTSAHLLIATIFGLISEDSDVYTFGVDVKLMPDPDTEIQLTVRRRGESPLTSINSIFHTHPS